MKRQDNKSDCPVNVALEAFGDSWSLLIVRDIVFWGKKTFGEFLDSDEHIASNILASRLAKHEQNGILMKQNDPLDSRKQNYVLTGKGLDLIPIVLEMSSWGSQHDPRATMHKEFIKRLYGDRQHILILVRETVRNGGSIFGGSGSVVERLKSLG